ncbi:MAG TPA: SSI family serine proteinase inhibitor [Actinomycetes bacterium]|nr:SSI family serine proteinase inhibitor [Actinomycetes bacterium]
MRIVVLLALALVSACSGGGTSTASPGTGPSSQLTVTVTDGDTVRVQTLTCDPTGGDHPDAAAACAVLDRLGAAAFAPVPADQACTEIYGGDQTATVTGVWRGEPVDASYDRSNGCQIARWDAIVDVLQVRGGV